MAASEALSVQGESMATAADPVAAPQTATVPAPSTAAPRWPQLMPIAQLVAVVLGVLAIIWNQQATTDSLRTELRAEINGVETELRTEINRVEAELRAEINRVETELRAEINRVETELRTEIGGLRAEIGGLRAEVAKNGQRLARIEGFLGIDTPGAALERTPEVSAR